MSELSISQREKSKKKLYSTICSCWLHGKPVSIFSCALLADCCFCGLSYDDYANVITSFVESHSDCVVALDTSEVDTSKLDRPYPIFVKVWLVPEDIWLDSFSEFDFIKRLSDVRDIPRDKFYIN